MSVFFTRNINFRKHLSYLKFRWRKLRGVDEKIFVIGRNKTGTTSIMYCLKALGYHVGNQARMELLIDDYEKRDFSNILKYCDSAEAFQDAPFSWPETYRHVYSKYPNARYIHLERESPELWYESIVRFHRKIVNDGLPISADHLKAHTYRRQGFLWQAQRVVYGVDEAHLYDKQIYIDNYETYNREVKDFFKGKDNFISIVLSQEGAAEKLARFLGCDPSRLTIPHLNRSR